MVEVELLKGVHLPSAARAMTNATQIAKIVSQLPGATGIVAPRSLDGSVAELIGDEPIVRPLILVVMAEETAEVPSALEGASIVARCSCSHAAVGAESEFPCNA